eukprot:Gb_26239 [translate_table: standard]
MIFYSSFLPCHGLDRQLIFAIMFGDLSSSLPYLALMVAVLASAYMISRRMKSKNKLRLPPGPPAVPIFGNWLQVGDDLNHRNLANLAKKYGDIVLLKMGEKNVVVVSCPNLAKEVLVSQGVEFGSRARNLVFDIFTGKGQDMVFTSYGDHWRRMRRIMTVYFFTNKVLHHSQVAWDDELNRVISDVKKSEEASTSGIVIRHRLQLMIYNTMYRIMFGRKFQSQQDHLFLQLKALNGERTRLAQSFTYNYADFIPILRPFVTTYLRRCEDLQKRRLALFKSCFLDERRNLLNTNSSRSVVDMCAMDYIIEAQKQGEITEDNVLYIVENMNIAGIETSLWSMEWAIAELVNNPNIQQKLRSELDEVLGRENLMQESDISKLPYLHAVVKETLRLHTAVPLLLPHMNLHQVKLGGYDIPAESKIVVNAWWLSNMSMGVGRLVQCFNLSTPKGTDKLDMTEESGQFSLHIAKHSQIVLKPREL